jgi:8-oxo-dGTP diphosphatase
VLVTAGIIWKDSRVLICRRPAGKRMAGYWEFPGGKLEPRETPPEGLKRELREELGIEALVSSELVRVSHEYEFGRVELIALTVPQFTGEVKPTEHDEFAWVLPSELATYKLAPADLPIAAILAQRPPR